MAATVYGWTPIWHWRTINVLKKTPIRGREAKRWSQREQNWTKVSSLMLHHSCQTSTWLCAKWTPRPYCSHPAHLLRPPLCSPSWLSLCSISSLLENERWESIPHHKSDHIILSFSITTLSLPPFTYLLTPSVSPFPPPNLLLPQSPCPSQKWIYGVMKAGGLWVGSFPITNVWFQELLQPSSPEKKLELYTLDKYHSYISSWLTKHVPQPQVICSVQLSDTMLMRW